MARKVKKGRQKNFRKASVRPQKKAVKQPKRSETERSPKKSPSASVTRQREPTPILTGPSVPRADLLEQSLTFKIQLNRIDGETTIGDLIVAFPRTRDALLKYGLRFDVEDAGYIYMTLNVFSALHGLKLPGLIQELTAVSRETSPPPSAQPLIQIAQASTA